MNENDAQQQQQRRHGGRGGGERTKRGGSGGGHSGRGREGKSQVLGFGEIINSEFVEGG